MSKVIYVTEEGLQKMKADLEQLKSERSSLSAQIAEARDKGDLSENAEYDAAKEAQGLHEMRISKLEETLSKARVMDESKIDTSQVQILTRVRLKNVATKAIMEYQIVAESEANFKEGRLSVGTPIAQALLGKKVGEVVDVVIPSGIMKLEVLEISR